MLQQWAPVQVAHFLEADVQPWAAALSAALFGAEPRQPQPDAWERLEEIATLGDTVDTVLRSWRLPLLEQLEDTPDEWQPAVIDSHAVDGTLSLDFATAAACCEAMCDLHTIHSLGLHGCGNLSDIESESDSESEHEEDHLLMYDLVDILQEVATMPALRTLQLDFSPGWRFGVVQALAMATWLSSLSQLPLAALDLSSHAYRIGATAATALARPLAALTTLTALDVSDNRLCSDGAEALAPALSRLSRLARLDLVRDRLGLDRLGADGAAALAQPLSTLTALTALELNSNGLFSGGVEALAPALSRLSRLAHLDLVHMLPALPRWRSR